MKDIIQLFFGLFAFTVISISPTSYAVSSTDSLNKDSQKYLSFYETHNGEQIHWEVNFDGSKITSIYKNGKKIPNELVSDYEDKVYNQLDEMRFGVNLYSFKMDDFDIDMDELNKNMEELRDKLKNHKWDIEKFKLDDEKLKEEMEELREKFKDRKFEKFYYKFDDKKFKERMENLEEYLKEHFKDFEFRFDFDEESDDDEV